MDIRRLVVAVGWIWSFAIGMPAIAGDREKAAGDCAVALLCSESEKADVASTCLGEFPTFAEGCRSTLGEFAERDKGATDVSRALSAITSSSPERRDVALASHCDVGSDCARVLDVAEPKPLLRFVENQCRNIDAAIWRRRAGLDPHAPDESTLRRCALAVKRLERASTQASWSRAQQQRRDALIEHCAAVETCQTGAADRCDDLPLCVAAVHKATCDGISGCTDWFRKRANAWQRQQQLDERNLQEQELKRKRETEAAADRLAEERRANRAQQLAEFVAQGQYARRTASERESADRYREAYEQQGRRLAELTERQITSLGGSFDRLNDTFGRIASVLGATKDPSGEVRPQLDPDQPIDTIYPTAEKIEYAIVTLPDPRVPRHRRSYEMALRAMIAGLADDDYVLDRYFFPWQDYSGKLADAGDRWTSADQTDDGRHGVLVFRHDNWRTSAVGCGRTSVRVFYVVAETVTYGVQNKAMRNALVRAADEVLGNPAYPKTASKDKRIEASPCVPVDSQVVHSYLDVPTVVGEAMFRPEEKKRDHTVFVVGPTFSSSLSSIKAAADDIYGHERVVVPAKVRAYVATLRRKIEAVEKSAEVAAQVPQLPVFKKLLRGADRIVESRSAETLPCPLASDRESANDAKDLRDVAQKICVYFMAERGRDSTEGRQLPNIEKTEVRAVSVSTTVQSNREINLAGGAEDSRFRFVSVAVGDEYKLGEILKNVDVDRIAILYESTSFGRGAAQTLQDLVKKRDDGLQLTHAAFPPNIASLRKRMRDADEANRKKFGIVSLAADNVHLPIEETAENGNEYPDGGRSALTLASADLHLRQLIDDLSRRKRPGLVIVAATDVRDRLYLFDRIGRELPEARLVDLEADLLLAHPDYVHATRGALMLSSTTLVGDDLIAPEDASKDDVKDSPLCPQAAKGGGAMLSFDSDRQALMYWLMRCLDATIVRSDTVIPYRIGRAGPIRENAGSVLSMRGGYAAGPAKAYGFVLLAAMLALLLRIAQRTTYVIEPPDSALPLGAPWWGAGLVNYKVIGFWCASCAGALLLFFPLGVQNPLVPVSFVRALSSSTAEPLLRFMQWSFAALACGSLIFAFAISRRLRCWVRYAEHLVRAAGGDELHDWSTIAGSKPRFVSTPIQAGLSTLLLDAPNFTPPDNATWRGRLVAFEAGFGDDLAARMALRELFWPSLRTLALAGLAILVSCVGILMLSLLYPVPYRGVPMTLGLVVAVLATIHYVGNTIAFERSSLLSRLFCGTDKGLQLSTQFMAVVLSPVVLLILSIIAADQPGVLEWSGGLAKILTGGR